MYSDSLYSIPNLNLYRTAVAITMLVSDDVQRQFAFKPNLNLYRKAVAITTPVSEDVQRQFVFKT